MRVTTAATAATAIYNVDQAATLLAKYQQQLSSGKSIGKPSDDPTGTVRAMQLRSALSRNAQYQTGANDAIAWLSAADTAYSQIVTTVQTARTRLLQGLNTGTNDPSANAAIAQQIEDARSSLISLANTTYNGRPVFGGTTAGGAAYDTSGTYVGDSGQVTRALGPNNTVTVSAVGTDVFGSGSTDLFSTLQNLADTLRTNPTSPSLTAGLSQLDAALGRISTAQANEGATYNRVQMAQTQGTAEGTALQGQLSSVEDADIGELAIKVTTANTSYQAALATTATIGQVSLLNFLR